MKRKRLLSFVVVLTILLSGCGSIKFGNTDSNGNNVNISTSLPTDSPTEPTKEPINEPVTLPLDNEKEQISEPEYPDYSPDYQPVEQQKSAIKAKESKDYASFIEDMKNSFFGNKSWYSSGDVRLTYDYEFMGTDSSDKRLRYEYYEYFDVVYDETKSDVTEDFELELNDEVIEESESDYYLEANGKRFNIYYATEDWEVYVKESSGINPVDISRMLDDFKYESLKGIVKGVDGDSTYYNALITNNESINYFGIDLLKKLEPYADKIEDFNNYQPYVFITIEFDNDDITSISFSLEDEYEALEWACVDFDFRKMGTVSVTIPDYVYGDDYVYTEEPTKAPTATPRPSREEEPKVTATPKPTKKPTPTPKPSQTTTSTDEDFYRLMKQSFLADSSAHKSGAVGFNYEYKAKIDTDIEVVSLFMDSTEMFAYDENSVYAEETMKCYTADEVLVNDTLNYYIIKGKNIWDMYYSKNGSNYEWSSHKTNPADMAKTLDNFKWTNIKNLEYTKSGDLFCYYTVLSCKEVISNFGIDIYGDLRKQLASKISGLDAAYPDEVAVGFYFDSSNDLKGIYFEVLSEVENIPTTRLMISFDSMNEMEVPVPDNVLDLGTPAEKSDDSIANASPTSGLFQIGGKVYSMDDKAGVMLDALDLEFNLKESDRYLDSFQYTIICSVKRNGDGDGTYSADVFGLDVMNLTDKDNVHLNDCVIKGISQDKYSLRDNEDLLITFPGGIYVGKSCNYKDLVKIFGECEEDDIYKSDSSETGYTSYKYSLEGSDGYSYTWTIVIDDGKLHDIKISRY